MLIIRSVHFLPDGRSVVDTVGGKRFRVLSRGMKDGYNTADIEHLEDSRVRAPVTFAAFNIKSDGVQASLTCWTFTCQVDDGEELEKLQELHDAVYDQAQVWFQNLKVHFHNQILQHFGPMPKREADIQVQARSVYTLN